MAQAGEKPLNFIRSVPGSGSKNISTSLNRVKLVFDKNVVNDSVWANNRTQIRMWKDGQKIAARVTRIKDTVDFSQRQNIYVKPAAGFSANTKYTIIVYPDLSSKNGEKLGKSVVITFTTGKGAKPAPIPQE
jgi:hypothetical protein